MRFAAASFSAAFLDFYMSIARYIEMQGHTFEFVNPDRYIAWQLRRNGFCVKLYPENVTPIDRYSEDDELIKYLSRLYRVKDLQQFIEKKNTEYSQSVEFFKTQTEFYDAVIFWNGSGTVEKDVVKELSINAFYAENGYFPNTLQLNGDGVNCNAEFSSLTYQQFLNFHFPNTALQIIAGFEPFNKKYSPIPRFIMRSFDSKFNYLAREAFMHNIRLSRAKKRFAEMAVDEIDFESIGPFIFFPLQVNSDTQIILNSDYDSMYDALEKILPELKKTGLKIVIKEHPFEVESVDYSRFIDNKTVFMVRKYSIETLIDKSEFVVNINSSVGLQAISRMRKTLVLGKCMYAHAPGLVEFKSEMNISNEISKTLMLESDVKCYIQHFEDSIFVKGNWKNISADFIHAVCSRILSANRS